VRPINETRRPDGTLTSETAYRLLKRRGGLARAHQLRQDGFKALAEMREKSILIRSLKAKQRARCVQCKAFAERMIALYYANQGHEYPLSDADRKLLG
jgi:hypothetical protein